MKVFGDIESVNLSTGERYQRVAGDGESRLLKSRGPIDDSRLGPRRDVVYGPREGEATPEEIARIAEKILNERKSTMHYKNGREAKNGDKIILLPNPGYGQMPIVGILYDAKPGNDSCNGKIAVTKPNDPCPNLAECLHVDDARAAIGDISKAPDTSAK